MRIPFFRPASAVDMFRTAVADDRVTFFVQPVSCALDSTRELYGECLARMFDLKGNMVGPRCFVPQLEESDNIALLDRHMLELALARLNKTAHGALACNLSSDTIQNKKTWFRILDLIAQNIHVADRLIIEITETRPVTLFEEFDEHLNQVRSLGCRIAVDDFGVGYMSPAMLLRLNIDIVKIDASFLRNIRSCDERTTSLHHIIGFARSVAPLVVVEGVEHARDQMRAITAGATHLQGYFISKPRPCQPIPDLELTHSQPTCRKRWYGKIKLTTPFIEQG